MNIINENGTINLYDYQKAADDLGGALIGKAENRAWFSKAKNMYFINTSKIVYD